MKLNPRKIAAGAVIAFFLGASVVASAASGALAGIQSSLRDISQKVKPAVVEINVTAVVQAQAQGLSPFGRSFGNGGNGPSLQQQGLGSGIIVKRAGDKVYILTNNHVVDSATSITVQLSDGREYKGTVVGTDPRKDIALVSITTNDPVTVAELGNSDSLEVGDLVLAVGNPLGFESTVTLGMVSATGRHGGPSSNGAGSYTDYIQTDAAINEGNSGGALVNIDGQVIGMNTWIAAPSGGNVGLGFAIPINNAKPEIEQFIAKGKVSYAWLGAMIGTIQGSGTDPQLANEMNLSGVKGAFVFGLFKGSPADRAGLKAGDYVTQVGNTPVSNADQLTQLIGSLPVGTTTSISVIRLGQQKTLTATLTERDAKDQVAQPKNLWPGMDVVDITDSIRAQVGIPQNQRGVIVASVADQASPAGVAGFQQGDVITGVNGKNVTSMLDFYRALNDSSGGTASFQVVRDGTQITIGLPA